MLTVNLHIDHILVVMYVCLKVKVIKSQYIYCNEVCDSIKNCIPHGEKQPLRDIRGGV